jgi:hypothetical protein
LPTSSRRPSRRIAKPMPFADTGPLQRVELDRTRAR